MIKKIGFVLFVLGCLLGSYMSFIEPFKLRVTQKTIMTSKWIYDDPIKIAILGDPHMIWPWMTRDHLQKIVDRTNSLEADIVFLVGDYVGDHPFGIQLDPYEAIKPFEDLKAPCGVYAVLGNHDMHRPSEWPQAIRESSVPVLDNQSIRTSCKKFSLNVAGIEDWWYGNVSIANAMKGIDRSLPTFFLTHNPDVFPLVDSAVALTVAGHTHAGQVRLPFIGAISFVVPSKYGDKYAYGHIHEDGKDLFVTAGLGMTGLPIRFLNVPEIALITLSNR